MTDLGRLSRKLSVPVVAQHVDPDPAGARTGSVPVEALRACGAVGAIVNHSERPLDEETIGHTIARLKGQGLASVLCARDAADTARLAKFAPDFLAVEPPDLIGGDRSVSTARPEVISEAAAVVRRLAPDTRLLCGAGVHHRQDVARAVELGSEGILVASAITRAHDPRAAISELLAGFPVARTGRSA